MTCYLEFTNLFVCVVWTAQINQIVFEEMSKNLPFDNYTFNLEYFCNELDQNLSSSKFTTSFSQPHSVTAIQNSVTPQSCHVTVTDEYAVMVRKLLRRTDNSYASILQELMVRGFQRLCFWTERVKEKFKFNSKLNSGNHQSFGLHEAFVITTEYGQIQFGNITIYNFPSLNEKIEVNPLMANCTDAFKTTYQAKSNQTTMKGEMLANGTRIWFILVYENTTILMNDIKTLQKNGNILCTRVKAEYNFDSFVAQTSKNQDVQLLLDLVTPAVLRQFIDKDPSGRITYAGLEQDVVAIDEFNKQIVVQLMANILAQYLHSEYKKPYRLPTTAGHANCLPDTIEYIQMDGLDRCNVYGSKVHVRRRGDNLVMKLAFSINFSNDEKKNDTILTIQERGAISQNKTVVVKKILIKFEASSPLELDKPSNLRFYVTTVKAEIIGEHQATWFQSIRPKLNAFFGEILTQIVLSWILYETN